MRVLMLTRRADIDDPEVGFVHGWIEQLADHPRVDHLDVICLEVGRIDLPPHVSVTSMGKELGYGRLRQVLTFQRLIAPVIRPADVVFGHMIPRYTLLAAPWAKGYGKPMVQWYAHREVHTELRLAHTLVDRVVTASPESFRLPSDKVTVIGHGIDMTAFHPSDEPTDAEERLIAAVGRLSPIKHYEALIDAAAELVNRPGFGDVRFVIAGGETAEDPGYGQSLRDRALARGLEDRFEFLGPLPPREIPALYRRAALTVNLCPTGGLDKAVVESFASGVPAVVRNETFRPLLAEDASALWSPDLDAGQIADRLAGILSMPTAERAALENRLADRSRATYSLEVLIDRLVGVFDEVIAARGGRA